MVDSIYHQVRKTDEQDIRIVDYQPNRQMTLQTIPPLQARARDALYL